MTVLACDISLAKQSEGATYTSGFVRRKAMQDMAIYASLLALEKLTPDSGHSTLQDRVGRNLQAPAVDERKEGVEALPVYVEIAGDGMQRGRRGD